MELDVIFFSNNVPYHAPNLNYLSDLVPIGLVWDAAEPGNTDGLSNYFLYIFELLEKDNDVRLFLESFDFYDPDEYPYLNQLLSDWAEASDAAWVGYNIK